MPKIFILYFRLKEKRSESQSQNTENKLKLYKQRLYHLNGARLYLNEADLETTRLDRSLFSDLLSSLDVFIDLRFNLIKKWARSEKKV